MADNTRVNELQQKLLQAMDILNAQALNSISFDKTITCTIESDKDKKDGKYEVSDGSMIFTAYSTDTKLRAGESVYVTVPQGNFENQKLIIGKITTENTKPFVFTTPFDTYFPMTENLLSSNLSGELLANSLEIYSNNSIKKLLDKKSNLSLSNYTRLGLKADFKSWIKEAVSGDYGILIEISTTEENIVGTSETTSEDKAQKNGKYAFLLNSSDMYGNPYNFETYYTQEIVVPIEQITGIINEIKISFYQNANFIDKYNEPIPCSEKGYKTKPDTNIYDRDDNGNLQLKDNDTLLSPNLFVTNIELSLGYDISIFDKDYVEIYTQDKDTYRRSTSTLAGEDNIAANQKVINMRWVHIMDGNPVDMSKKQTDTNYEVRWYKYRVGAAAADEYCGVYWERISEATDEVTRFTYIFNPDVNKQQEKIKAIVVYEGNTPYRSNELIFENEEQLPPSEEAQHIMNALNIQCDDDTNGNYMIYGQDNSIKDTTYGKETRTLSAWFDTNNDGKHSDRVQQSNDLVWMFPTENSMIELIDITIPSYKISSYYSPSKSNNTIRCQYTLNNVVYTTEKEFTFGPAGTMGSDQTLIIDFVGDKNSVIEGEEVVKFEIQLYDNQNKQQVIPEGSVEWKWYYNSDLKDNKDDNGNLIGFPQNIECSNAIWNSEYSFKLGSLYILQASVGNLTTYFPVPITNSSGEYSYIKGATQVIYQSSGEPSYSREEYQLFKKDDKVVEHVNWRIVSFEEDPYMATLSDLTDQKGFLKPVQVYVRNASVYGVQAYFQNKESVTILWTQPILVIQNQWSSNVINKWDGKSIEMDKDNGIILSQAIAAGHKDSENRFSGVMIGSWKDTDTAPDIAAKTGIYGFHEGAMSYAWKDDGTGFIGKDGLGRINFDGNKATISSSEYKIDPNNNITDEKLSGSMTIDLNEPYIQMKRGSNQILINASKTGAINNSFNSNAPFQIGSNFCVDWTGKIYAKYGYFDGTIYSEEGNIGGWVINKTTLSCKNDKVVLNSNGTISGATIKAGTLASNGGDNGYIDLQGYLTVEDYGHLGYITSNIPGSANKPGIGMDYSKPKGDGTTDIYGEIKVTEQNCGLNFKKNYISIIENKITIGTSNTEAELDFSSFSANKQKGIYARFA